MSMASFQVEAPAPAPRKTRGTVFVEELRRGSVAVVAAMAAHEVAEKEGITRWQAWSNIVLGLIGGLVCLLPGVMASTGYACCPALLFLAAMVIIRCGYAICEACRLAEASGATMSGYEDLAKAAGFLKPLALSKNSVLLCNTMLSMCFLTDALAGLWPGGAEHAPWRLLYWLFITPLVCCMALLRDLTQLSKWAFIGLIGMLVELAGILVGCIMAAFRGTTASYGAVPEENWSGQLGMALSILLFAFSIMTLVPSIRSQMRDPDEMPHAFRDAIVFVLFVYQVIMGCGYFAFGSDVSDNIITDISTNFPVFGKLPAFGLLINVCFTVPLFLFCVISAFEATGSDALRTKFTLPNLVGRVLLVLILAGIGSAVPALKPAAGIVASAFCIFNNIWCPLVFYHCLRRKTGAAATSKAQKLLDLGISLLGVLIFIYGLSGSIKDFQEAMRPDAPEAVTNVTNVTLE